MNPPAPPRRRRAPPASAPVAHACALACTLLLSACAPDYNWREIRPSGEGYAVMLPGKPASMSRPINLDGLAVTMAMSGARVDDRSFTVGMVVLPDAEPATRERARAAMRAAMVRNIAGRETQVAEMAVPVHDLAGRTSAMQPAVRVEASGRIADRPAHLSALFVARGHRAWQAVVIGPAPDAEHAPVFLDSFRLLE